MKKKKLEDFKPHMPGQQPIQNIDVYSSKTGIKKTITTLFIVTSTVARTLLPFKVLGSSHSHFALMGKLIQLRRKAMRLTHFDQESQALSAIPIINT